MTIRDRNASSWLSVVSICSALAASNIAACTARDVDETADRAADGVNRAAAEIKEGAKEVKENMPPASEVKADLKQAGKEAGDTLRNIGDNVKREAKETRDLVRDRPLTSDEAPRNR